MVAVIISGGKQYLVKEDDVIYVERIKAEKGSDIVFEKVLMIDNQIGDPFVAGARVVGKIEKHGKQKKILVIKHLSQKHHRRKHGHRQSYTKIKITSIAFN